MRLAVGPQPGRALSQHWAWALTAMSVAVVLSTEKVPQERFLSLSQTSSQMAIWKAAAFVPLVRAVVWKRPQSSRMLLAWVLVSGPAAWPAPVVRSETV